MDAQIANKKNQQPKAILLKDYLPPAFLIPETQLHFSIEEHHTRVKSSLSIHRNPEREGTHALVLNGERLTLLSVKIDGRPLTPGEYVVTDETLTIDYAPDRFVLEIETQIDPAHNRSLEGLYRSRGIYCTQCEAHGFRKITYFLDRPDVLSRFTVTIKGKESELPVMLSNGNQVGHYKLSDDQVCVIWKDPFPKPAYLFALVAGDLALVEDHFMTESGRKVTLRIFVEKGSEDRCGHAMTSLKKSMRWDEQVYGREYDLDIFHIVAVDDFNFGAMENKSLNIFNSAYVLASTETATDAEFEGIESVVAHEYFHNWTGNRITCRDWFQLTLKEGLTVFRDEEFSADMNSRPVKRIDTVRYLRDVQFPEDAGPNKHPIQPKSYIEINNFYTATVYSKGAEIIRMLHTFLGKEGFRKGTDLYFERFDGQAVTCDDWIAVMAESSGRDFSAFKRWYSQAGTPHVAVSMEYDSKEKLVTLNVTQECGENKPFTFPLSIGLHDRSSGKEVLSTQVLTVTECEHSFTFKGIEEKPIPSLLRNFSAPVKLRYPYTEEELGLLLMHDKDPFNRYEAGQRLAKRTLLGGNPPSDEVLSAFGKVLGDGALDPALRAETLILPTVTALIEEMDVADFDAADGARENFVLALAERHEGLFLKWYEGLSDDPATAIDASAMGRRRLKNICLSYLSKIPEGKYAALVQTQYAKAGNMTDRLAALKLLCDQPSEATQHALTDYLTRWGEDPLTMNKWFTVQAGSRREDVLDVVKQLERHSSYSVENPNKIRALIGCFTRNLVRFHAADGSGYEYLADKILEIDRFNHNVAGRLATAFKHFAKMEPSRKELMRTHLERLLAAEGISKDVYEIVSKTLGVF